MLWTILLWIGSTIWEVNGLSVIGLQHSEVVAAIKAGGDSTSLLVVDAETEEFFKRCGVLPTEDTSPSL
ncbi:hypothetical protein FQN60_002620 [Etheostoma spectabile]|uniref:Uncharacterized protein n=1 Tax=Etheostoma spectabile TaxID=54343 RepID=A0A5J5CK21_9PERO|nr:hypothetical protein FQN60_002620 [Etheostoma spectabile]